MNGCKIHRLTSLFRSLENEHFELGNGGVIANMPLPVNK